MSPNRVRPALQFVFFSSTTGPLPDPRRTPSCPPDSNKRSRSAVMIDSRERAHFETPRPGRSAQEKKRSRPHHLARCSNLSSLWAWSHHQEFFWGPSDASVSVALHSRGHLKPPGAPEVPMDARKRKGLIKHHRLGHFGGFRVAVRPHVLLYLRRPSVDFHITHLPAVDDRR